MARDPFVHWKRNPKADDAAIEQFLANGGEVKNLRLVEKNFKEDPEKDDEVFIFSRDDRLSAE